jgi:hypothetical protein
MPNPNQYLPLPDNDAYSRDLPAIPLSPQERAAFDAIAAGTADVYGQADDGDTTVFERLVKETTPSEDPLRARVSTEASSFDDRDNEES